MADEKASTQTKKSPEVKSGPVTYHEYNIPSMNSFFAWSALGLLAVSLWMVWDDYSRDWKDYQRRFNDIEIAKNRADLESAKGAISQADLTAAQHELEASQEALEQKSGEEAELNDGLQGLLGKWYAADQAYKFAKADLDVVRFEYDEARKHGHGEEEAKAAFDDTVAKVDRLRAEFEILETEKTAIQGKLAALRGDVTAAKKSISELTAETTRLEGRLGTIEHSFVKDYFRDRPLVDFLAPTIKVQQAILPNLHEDVNFMTVPRVDRCHSCHMGAATPGYTGEEIPPVFRTHSRYDLLIGNNHPIETMGCSGCHNGAPRALTFSDAAHTPQNEEQHATWEAEHHYHKLHHWDFPMLPLQYAEAGCANCHIDESRVPGADTLNAGREIIENYGCFGCHKIDRPGYRDLRKVGPMLTNIGGKVEKNWVAKWVTNPKSFRASTRMPRIWGNSNTTTATSSMNYPLRDKVEVEAVTRYLMERSVPYAGLEKPIGTGNVARGKWQVENRGCKGCHVVGVDDTGEGREFADHGPNLNDVGSKLTIDWMYAWIRDPAKLWPGTLMPNLRLTEQEALDAATYLKTLRNTEFEQLALTSLDNAEASTMLETVTHEYLLKETTLVEADRRLQEMSDDDDRYQYLGGKLIARQGCFGCHEGISGFEDAQPIGTEVTTWASKLITQLDFGLVDMPHTKHDWLRGKLQNPRKYDEGKVESKHPQDLLRMPNFQFTDDQLDKVVTAVLSFQKDLVQPEGHRHLDDRERAMEGGRRVIQANNCRGCHVIENRGGGLATVLEGGLPFAPPVLVADYELDEKRQGHTRQGAKVDPGWFFEFLKAPTTIRPWLNVRMPTFKLSDGCATSVVSYFSALAEERYPYEYFDRAQLDPALVHRGKKLFEEKQCINCHLPLDEAKKLGVKEEELAPNLVLAKSRLKYEWLANWLKDPSAIQEGTKMPSFFYYYDEDEGYIETGEGAVEQIDALRAYLQYHGEPLPPLRLVQR